MIKILVATGVRLYREGLAQIPTALDRGLDRQESRPQHPRKAPCREAGAGRGDGAREPDEDLPVDPKI